MMIVRNMSMPVSISLKYSTSYFFSRTQKSVCPQWHRIQGKLWCRLVNIHHQTWTFAIQTNYRQSPLDIALICLKHPSDKCNELSFPSQPGEFVPKDICERCKCSEEMDNVTSLHVIECEPITCDDNCAQVNLCDIN